MGKSQLNAGDAAASDPVDQVAQDAPAADTSGMEQVVPLTEDRVREMIDEAIKAAMLDADVAKQIEAVIAGEEFRGALTSLVAAQVDTVLAERAPEPGAVNVAAPSGDAMVDSAAADAAAVAAAKVQRDAADKAVASQAKAAARARDEAVKSATADFELAQAGEGDTIEMDGALKLRFADNEGFIATLPPLDATPGAGLFATRADQLIQAADIPFSANDDSALITAVWLISNTGSRRQEISGGLRVGGGSEAKFPAGHIAFLVG